MKKSIVILIVLVAAGTSALAFSLYTSMQQHGQLAKEALAASCQPFHASVLVGDVLRVAKGKACLTPAGTWRVYTAGSRSLAVPSGGDFHHFHGSPGLTGKAGQGCPSDKSGKKGLHGEKYQKFLDDIHGWNRSPHKSQERFEHPQIKPRLKDQKKPQGLQPLLVQAPVGLYHH